MNAAKLTAYELIKKEELPDINSTGYLLRHNKTKARVVVIENDDDNKVFNIGFRTPPTDSTGIPHIVEHTVLCGSRKFPVKDPFAELDKGSLNTFLNAMTYPDKTVYPVASVNDKDFQNLMDVYLDAVFYPAIYDEEKIFRQEGWHYELEEVDGELIYNGVVFNEMKGAFSSQDERLDNLVRRTLFPDTEYGVVSGGDPKDIPDLKWEDYLDFHRRYYHPSNSYIYLYGDMDFEEKLGWIDDEYLSNFDYLEVDSRPKSQKPFEKMREAKDYYSIPSGESTENKTCFAYAAVCGEALDAYKMYAFQILEYALVEGVGAPVKEALVKAGIGTEIEGGYSEPFMQPFFEFSAKNASPDQKDRFLEVLQTTLKQVIKEGINKDSLKAAINAMEFQIREADFGRFPKGLMYGLNIYDSWLYDDDKPFVQLKTDEIFSFLRKQIDTGYYEELIEKCILDNPHSVFVTLDPKPGLASEEEAKEKEKLQKKYDSLSTEEKEEIIQKTKELKKYQEEPSTPEQLATIPMLELSDIDKKAKKAVYELREISGIKTLYHDIFTNGITYIKLVFDITDLEEYAPYIGILADVMGVMDTDKYKKLDLSNEMLFHSGGYGISTDYFTSRKTDKTKITFEMNVKVLFDETDYVLKLLAEIVSGTHLNDTERLKEIIAERRSGKLASMQAAGHSVAINRTATYYDKALVFLEKVKGLEYYDFISELDDNFDSHADNLVAVLEGLRKCLFSEKRLFIDVITTDKGYEVFKDAVSGFTSALYDGKMPETKPDIIPDDIVKNEGIITSGGVQYVAMGGNFKNKGVEYNGVYRLLKTLLSYEYLWNEVRVKGGAYGVMCAFTAAGKGYMASYRDPNLAQTVEAFKSVADYLESVSLDETQIVKFIIGSVRELDMPKTPKMEGVFAYNVYMTEDTFEAAQKRRDELLTADINSIRACAKMIRTMLEDGYICVVGSEEKIKAESERFGKIKVLK